MTTQDPCATPHSRTSKSNLHRQNGMKSTQGEAKNRKITVAAMETEAKSARATKESVGTTYQKLHEDSSCKSLDAVKQTALAISSPASHREHTRDSGVTNDFIAFS